MIVILAYIALFIRGGNVWGEFSGYPNHHSSVLNHALPVIFYV